MKQMNAYSRLATLSMLSVLFMALMNSCSTMKVRRLVGGGSVATATFNETIAYDTLRNWMIINVKLNNEQRTRRFLFDTGAVSVVKSEVARELGLKVATKNRVGSSTNAAQTVPFTQLAHIYINGIDFQEIGAVVMDFNTSPELSCLSDEIDGIIGANLMRLAIWQIDFQQKQMQLSHQREAFSFSEDTIHMPFKTSHQGTPHLTTKIYGTKVRFGLDTGKSTGIGINKKKFQSIHFNNDTIRASRGYGIAAIGVYGSKEDTLYQVQLTNLQLGDLSLDTALASFSDASGNLIGNQFWKNYRLTLDWQQNRATLDPYGSRPMKTLQSTGFGYTFKNGELVISFIQDGSSLHKAGVPLGSQIISIDGQNYEQMTQSVFCAIRREGLYDKNAKSLTMTVKIPNGGIQTITIEQRQFL